MKKHTALHRAIRQWYEVRGRKDLPWRNTHDPYAIYVSEIMLQQTQVKTVLEKYYEPFLKQFPTLEILARASEAEILKAWEGMGYYSRARNLHRAAQEISGAMPTKMEDLLTLPGVGKNTAHAVACFSSGAALPVLEANVKRIVARLYAIREPSEKELWKGAETLLDRADPFTHNQAMMDIGALLCTPKNPRCGECPLEQECKGKKDPESYPRRKIKKPKPIRTRAVLVYENEQGEFWLTQNATRFLHGLYSFPQTETMRNSLIKKAKKLGVIEQHYSHFTLQAEIWKIRKAQPEGEGTWCARSRIQTLALSRVDEKIFALACARLTRLRFTSARQASIQHRAVAAAKAERGRGGDYRGGEGDRGLGGQLAGAHMKEKSSPKAEKK